MFLCPKKLIGNNISKEHIIKNSIGGKKTTKYFICNECNKETGEKWDILLDKNFGEYLSILLKIKRDRGDKKRIKITDRNKNKNF